MTTSKPKGNLVTASQLLQLRSASSSYLKSRKRVLLPDEVASSPVKRPKAEPLESQVTKQDVNTVGWLIGSWDGRARVKVNISLYHYTLIGRNPSCDMSLLFPQVSNYHLRLYAVRTNTAYSFVTMQDLSTNGFKLNGGDYRSGRKIEVEGRDLGSGKRGVVLVHGDRIHLPGWDGEFIYHHSPAHFELMPLSPMDLPFQRPSNPAPAKTSPPYRIGNFSILDRPIGTGTYGVVNIGYHIPSSTIVAVKSISTSHETTAAKAGRIREINILKSLPCHPGVNQLLAVLEEDGVKKVHLVLELVTGGDLFSYVDKHCADGGLGENEIKWLGWQMVEAVGWLHRHGVAHRDLKMENILIHSSAAYPRILVADFGLSTFIKPKSRQTLKRSVSLVGTIENMPPELLSLWLCKHGYQEWLKGVKRDSRSEMDWESGDAWAVGVILYLCFSAVHPFDYGNDADALGSQDDQLTQDPNATISMRRSKPPVGVLAHLLRRKDTLQRIIRGRFTWDPPKKWESMSETGKDFIKQFLDPEATTRLSISEARTHPWMHESKEDLEQLWERVVLGGEVVGLGSKA